MGGATDAAALPLHAGTGTLRRMGVPSTPTDADLARRDLENEVGLWSTAVAFAPDGGSGREGDAAWFASGLPIPFFNQVLATGDGTDPAALARAIDAIRSRDVPFLVRLRAGIDDDLVKALEGMGFREDLTEAYPAMALHPIPDGLAAAGGPPDLDIRQAVDAAGLEDHVAVVSAGFGLPIDIARRLVPVEELTIPGFASFVGYLGDRPVATSLGYTEGGTVGIYNVATLDDARRRGYGAALTRRAIADGAARGATVAILQSSDMGRPVYEAMGFREVLAFRVFADDRPG